MDDYRLFSVFLSQQTIYDFLVSFNLKVSLYVAKKQQL